MKIILIIGLLLLLPSLLAAETVRIRNDHLEVSLSNTGAELQSILHRETGTEYLWQGDPDTWSGRAPNMFPVNVRFKDHKFTHHGREYEMPFMGLVVSAELEAIQDANAPHKIVHVLNSSSDTLQQYPFPFRLEIHSELSGNALLQRFKIVNTGTESMYFALGGHPGLRAPFIHGRDRSDYEIVFSEKLTRDRILIRDGLQSNERIPFLNNEDRLSLDDDRIPDSGLFMKNHPSRRISLALKGKPPYVTLDLQDFPNTNIWTPPGRPYVCIEPMVGHHDLETSPIEISKKSYLQQLAPAKSRSFQYQIIVYPQQGADALR